MEFGNLPEPGSNAQPGTRLLPFEIDLNETPLSSPRETLTADAPPPPAAAVAARGGGFSGRTLCCSCGRDADAVGEMVVCCGCGRGFHMRCLGTREEQKSREWKCFKCLLSNGSGRLRGGSGSGGGGGGVGLLDMNASPPREADGEGGGWEVAQSSEQGGPARDGEQNGDNIHTLHDVSIIGRSLNAPVTTSKILGMENGFNLLKASHGVTFIPKSGFEDIVQHRLDRISKEADFISTLRGGLRPNHFTTLNFLPQSQSEVYLQALREYIHEKQGVLGDGWRVEFIYCKNRYKTFAVYCAPDGSRFESMADVAGHLGLLTNYHSLEKGLHSNNMRNEFLRFSSVNNYRENQYSPRSSYVVGISAGIGIMGHQTGKVESSSRSVEAVSMEHGHCGFEMFQDVFPLQFEDLFILSLGNIDPRPSYHNASQIWPVGYKSCWHDKITGSIFVSEVVDGGDAGPNFKVRRFPCSTHPIPISLTVLFRRRSDSYDGRGKEVADDSTISELDDDDPSIQMMLTDDSPPNLEDVDFQKTNSSTTESRCVPHSFASIKQPDNSGLVDCIGEFLVEGRSSSLAWELASQTLLCACHEAYRQIGIIQFCCKHNVNGVNVKAADCVDSLSKFCFLSGPTDVPHLIQSTSELNTNGEMLKKWLLQDRFGLDAEFVQEILEKLPGVHACSEYKFLNKRSQNSGSQTVRSGFLWAKRKSNVQGGKETESFFSSNKTTKTQFVEKFNVKKPFPFGKPLSPKLPAYLIGDVLQAWEFLWRFSEVLGLEETFSFQELENELMNPWLEVVEQPEGTESEMQNYGYVALCTGTALRKAHTSLLKVLVGELLLKVAGYLDPNSDAGECKSRRGRKKDAENSFASKKMKFDMLQMNELTWPELARRYILVVLSMESSLDTQESTCRESGKIFHCLQGDGGTLCGYLTGVAGMEADAMLLAEALKQVFGSVKKNDFIGMDQDGLNALTGPKTTEVNGSEVPEWAQALEPVRKLPTNVGARIRNCVHDALRKNPPEWAKKILEHSISKEVYKGNASGPTKRAVVSLLADVSQQNIQPKSDKKEKVKSVSTVSDLIMKLCRIVLRRAAAEDEEKIFFNLLGRTLLNPNDNDDEGRLGYPAMVSRPLDFRTIDIRLAAGAYGGSHKAFLEDVREVWNNIRVAYADQSDFIDLAETLSQKFEDMYENEVLAMVQKFSQSTDSICTSDEARKELNDLLVHANESSLPKAPWDDGVCKVCGVDKDDDNVLLCDTCDSEYHTYCLIPPLARIPEGNWYCPSCVAGQFKSQGTSHGTQVNWCRKKRYQGDFSRNFMETLSRLAGTMGSREYWEFSVEERILLIKLLCDETLNSSILRDHLDNCAIMSADLQQKLKSLSSEWKIQKFREEILAANLEKANTVHNKVGELGPNGLANMLSRDGKLIGQLPNKSNNVQCFSGNFPQLEVDPLRNGRNDYNEQTYLSFSKNSSEKAWSPLSAQQGLKDSSTNGPLPIPTQVPQGLVSLDSVRTHVTEHSHHLASQSDASALQVNNLEMTSLKHQISALQDSISHLDSEYQKVCARKEILGRDSDGRVYWAFGRPETCSLLVVNGSAELQQSKVSEHRGPTDNNGVATSAWVSYQSDTEIGELIRWLRDDDAREKELKESILLWQRNKPKVSNNAENRIQNEKQPSCSKTSDGGKTAYYNSLLTKALTTLEKKYGPCLESETIDNSKKQGQKGKETREGAMYRCECLEPIWPSRHHCPSCHQTYSTSEELERHSDGKCSAVTPIPKNNKVNEESLKRKKMKTETSIKKRPDDKAIDGASKSEKNELGLNASKFQDPECPYNFKEISAKFVTQNSLKELVRDVGLIGSSGTLSFAPSVSPYLNDPSLRLVYTRKKKKNSINESTDLENQRQRSVKGSNITGGMNCDSDSNNFPRSVGNDRDEMASKVERLNSDSTNERGQFLSSLKNRSPAHGMGKSCIIPESALRKLVGRVSHILRRLKMNLLDIDAALPEEALRPSMVHLEKRFAWRTFVKSAGSIYEMVQATIVLENMIKADYLKKDWWYWSSLSAAANISTLSALALRMYTLDAAIIFEKPLCTSDSTEIPKPSYEEEGGTLPNLGSTNNSKESSPVIQKTRNDSTDISKPKSRQNKRRKDSGG